MTNYPLKRILIPFHIICGIILILNLISSHICQLTLYFAYSQIIKYCFLISGAILFFLVRTLKAYLSIYTFSPVVLFVSFLFGLAGLFVFFVISAIIWPKSEIASSNNFHLYAKFSGPMKVPDEFEITETKYFIFEKRLAEFTNQENNEDLKNSKIDVVNNSVQIKFTIENRDYETNRIAKVNRIIKIAIK